MSMERSFWQQENDRLWKQAQESGLRVPIEPSVEDMPGASDEELENERLRRENQSIKSGLEWSESLGGESVPLAPDASPKMSHEEGEASKHQAKIIEDMIRKPSDGWPRLPHEQILALPEVEQLLIRQHEEEMIAGNRQQLRDICDKCDIKPQFAKTYRVLRRMRSATTDSNQDLSDSYTAALIESSDAILGHKLAHMANHFQIRWGEPIDNWSGEEGAFIDRAGCSLILVTFGAATAIVAALC